MTGTAKKEATPVKAWMEKATKEEQVTLAEEAGTSRAYLYQLATGHRSCGPKLARRLQEAAEKMKDTNPKLPLLPRAKLCPEIWGNT